MQELPSTAAITAAGLTVHLQTAGITAVGRRLSGQTDRTCIYRTSSFLRIDNALERLDNTVD